MTGKEPSALNPGMATSLALNRANKTKTESGHPEALGQGRTWKKSDGMNCLPGYNEINKLSTGHKDRAIKIIKLVGKNINQFFLIKKGNDTTEK